jgi:hypothetical protein
MGSTEVVVGTEGIPAAAVETFDRLYGIEIEKMDAELGRTIAQKTGELASRGVLNSGGAVTAIFDLINATVRSAHSRL